MVYLAVRSYLLKSCIFFSFQNKTEHGTEHTSEPRCDSHILTQIAATLLTR